MTGKAFLAALAGLSVIIAQTAAAAAPDMTNTARSPDPLSNIAATVRQLVDALNGGRFKEAAAAFARDASIVDDLAPYRWSGPDAASQWMAAMGENASKLQIKSISMEAKKPSRTDVSGNRAYVVVPGVLHLGTLTGELRASGTITFTLRREDGRWLVTSLVWTGPQPV